MSVSSPLVSVIVITYNSCVFVVETLESIKNQTYHNIELIISDDGSSDQTVRLCNDWVNANQDRFVRVEVISVESNTGIPANCNRGFRTAEGVWIKFIAGDDILDNNCIESFVDFVESDASVELVESKSQFFKNEFKQENFAHIQDLGGTGFFDSSVTASQQYEALLRRNYIHAPSVFIKRSAIAEVGGFDEKYRLIEDHPLWLRLTKCGSRFYFMPKVTVYYRLHCNSVYASKRTDQIFNKFYKHRRNFDIDYIIPNVSLIESMLLNYNYYRLFVIDYFKMNKNIKIFKLLYYFSDFKYYYDKKFNKLNF